LRRPGGGGHDLGLALAGAPPDRRPDRRLLGAMQQVGEIGVLLAVLAVG